MLVAPTKGHVDITVLMVPDVPSPKLTVSPVTLCGPVKETWSGVGPEVGEAVKLTGQLEVQVPLVTVIVAVPRDVSLPVPD